MMMRVFRDGTQKPLFIAADQVGLSRKNECRTWGNAKVVGGVHAALHVIPLKIARKDSLLTARYP